MPKTTRVSTTSARQSPVSPQTVQGASERFFLTTVEGFSPGGDEFDVRVTNFGLARTEKALSEVSRRRYVEFKNFEIAPGKGRGIAVIDGVEYTITYAWRGLSEYDYRTGFFEGGGQQIKSKAAITKAWNNVLSWTVRLKGAGIAKHMGELSRAIIIDERGSDTVTIPRHKLLTGLYGLKQPTRHALRKKLKELQEALAHHDDEDKQDLAQSDEQIEEQIAKIFSQKTFTLPIMSVDTYEPWRLLLAKKPKKEEKAKE